MQKARDSNNWNEKKLSTDAKRNSATHNIHIHYSIFIVFIYKIANNIKIKICK